MGVYSEQNHIIQRANHDQSNYLETCCRLGIMITLCVALSLCCLLTMFYCVSLLFDIHACTHGVF